jgi:hypothetical protein
MALHSQWYSSGSSEISLLEHKVNGSQTALLTALKMIRAHKCSLEYRANSCIK